MRELRPQGLDFLEHPPEHMSFEGTMHCSADELFAVLAATEKLPLWLDDFVSARWLTDEPHGVGSRREVRLKTLTVRERFVSWQPGERIAFTMEAISLPIVNAVGEDMRITRLDDRSARLSWRVAYDPVLLARLVHPLIRWNFGRLFARSLANLERITRAT